MNYPKLRVLNTQRQMVDTFKGYNHNLRIGEGEFYEMENMTSDYYPILSPRGKRKLYWPVDDGSDIIAKDAVCYYDGYYFVMRKPNQETMIPMILGNGPKQFISMGVYVIIMPEKKYVNTETGEWGMITNTFFSNEGGYQSVKFELCDISGGVYKDANTTKPTAPEDNALWIDTSSIPHTLKRYSADSGMWVTIPTTYVKISCPGINQGFKQYDGVSIYGVLDESAQGLNASHILQAVGDGYIVVTGILDKTIVQDGDQDGAGIEGVVVARRMPDMDFVIESGNRLWGCKYGRDKDGKIVNEIYASKLGDFKNWNCFMGLSTDSYVASCGTDGPFTGAITHIGYPLFFKENYIHKVYGNQPSNFQVQTTACRGVQEGCHKSLAIVNETLFYKSRGGVCAYDGSLPVDVSYSLGNEQYSNAVAGGHNSKYYISMKDTADNYHLLAYDVLKGMWHREDNLRVDGFCSYRGAMYAIDHNSQHIMTMGSSVDTPMVTTDYDFDEFPEDPVKWMVQTGPIGTDMPDMKYISNLVVRLSPSKGAVVRFWVQYDSMGGWEHIHTVTCRNLRSLAIPLKPRRCDHLRLKIEGEGDVRIHSITKTIEQGSDVS